MGVGKNWTKQEEEYLTENWGTLSVARIAKNLGRTENAIIVRKCRLGLGAFLDNGEYVTGAVASEITNKLIDFDISWN